MTKQKTKQIRLKETTYNSLVKIGQKNESFDDIIWRLVQNYKKEHALIFDEVGNALAFKTENGDIFVTYREVGAKVIPSSLETYKEDMEKLNKEYEKVN